MIFELRLKRAFGTPATKTVKFTSHTCGDNPVGWIDTHFHTGWFDFFELLERHFQGFESTRDYGFGKGYEPIMVGCI